MQAHPTQPARANAPRQFGPPATPAPNAHAQVRACLRALFYPGDVVEVRRLPSARSTWHLARDVEAIFAAAVAANRAGENVYFGVNPRAAHGRRGNAGVAARRCVFIDFDGRHLTTTTPEGQVAEVRQRIAGWPEPAAVIFSGHGVHVYWVLTEPADDADAWDELLDAVVTTLGGDPGAKGAERVMRLPGFLNHKPPVALAELSECDPERQVEWADLACCAFHANLPEPPATGNVERAVAAHAGRQYAADRASVIDAFNATVPVAEMLGAAGYDVAGRHFRRPGKADRGFSGIIRPNRHGRLVSAHWSTNDPLNDRRFGGGTCGIHDAFDAFARLEHGGDVGAAVKAAAALLGIPLPKQKSDPTILAEITASADADAFATAFFAEQQTAATRGTMRCLLARFTSNPRQVDRILAIAGGKAVAA